MKKYWIIVIILSIVLFLVRTYIALSVPGFSDDAAYAHLRNAKNIMETGLPILHDPLIPRQSLTISLFDYFIAILGFIMPIELAAKILPNIFAALLAPLLFLLSFQISSNSSAALFSTFLFSVLPDFFGYTFNSASPLPFVFFFLTLLYIFLLNYPIRVWCYLLIIIIFAFFHPSIIIFVTGMGITLLLKLVEHSHIKHEEIELTLLTIFLAIPSQLLLYNTQLTQFGTKLLSSNIPQELLQFTFPSLSIIDATIHIGLLTIIFMLYIIYTTLFQKRKTQIHMFIGLLAAAAIFLWTKTVPLHLGILFFAYPAFLIFNVGYSDFISYLKNTKIVSPAYIHIIIVLIIIISTLAPLGNIIKQQLSLSPSTLEDEAITWFTKYTPTNTIIITLPIRGQYLAYNTNRHIILDTYYYLTPEAQVRYTDVQRLFVTPFEIEALEIMEKYSAKYIYSPPFQPMPNYIPGKCFSIPYMNQAQIYSKSPACTMSTL